MLSHTLHALLSSADAGCVFRYLPALHAVQLVCAGCGWYVPVLHAVQATDSAEDAGALLRYLPAPHRAHDDRPSHG